MINNAVRSLLLLAATGCSRSEPAHPGAFQGVLELNETVLAFETGGRLQKLTVEEGDRVEAGALIAEIDDDMVRASRSARVLEAEAARSEADLVGAGARAEDVAALEARVRAARASEGLLQKNLERDRSLLAQQVIPPARVDDLTAQFDRARAERESLEAQLALLRRGARREEKNTALARAEVAKAALALEDDRLLRYTLRAPVAGRVLERSAELGEVVAAGAPVITLGDPRRPYADVFVAQARLGGIDVGDRVELFVDAEPRAFAGVVEHISRRTEFTPRYLFSERERPNLVVRVRVRVADPEERLHAGVPVFAEIHRDGKPGAAR
jgi:HlyD family secretion protein